MDTLKILDTLKKINPWHKTGAVSVDQLQEFKRREFENLDSTLQTFEMATLILGGRRVGKSVLMYQLIDKLLQDGVPPKRILFIQGDNPIIKEHDALSGGIIPYLINIYENYMIEESLDTLQEPVYIFIDEAQALKGWKLHTKTSIDLKHKVKFIITGSSSFELRRGSDNPLTGRVMIEVIQPFSLADYVAYFVSSKNREDFRKRLKKLSSKFQESLLSSNSSAIAEIAEETKSLIKDYKIKNRFDDFLTEGGFPWVINHRDRKEEVRKYLRDLLTTTISKDIMTRVEIRETLAFERLMINLCTSIGDVIKYKTLASKLGIDERVVAKYADYYAESHWIHVSSQFEFHRKQESIKSEKKIYIIDTGIINTLAFKEKSEIETDRQYRSSLIENVLHNHLLNLKQTKFGSFQNQIPFWRDSESQKEIDFIFEGRGDVVPIEVKGKKRVDDKDVGTIQKFKKKHKSVKMGIITTENEIREESGICSVPYIVLILLL